MSREYGWSALFKHASVYVSVRCSVLETFEKLTLHEGASNNEKQRLANIRYVVDNGVRCKDVKAENKTSIKHCLRS